MFAQKRKTRFFPRLLYLSIFLAFIIEVKGTSWSASWSWPAGRPARYDLSDEEIIDRLYSRAGRSTPDHPSFLERMRYRKEIETLNELDGDVDSKKATGYSTATNRKDSSVSSYFHRVYHS